MSELESLTNYFRKMIGSRCRAIDMRHAEHQPTYGSHCVRAPAYPEIVVTVTIPGEDVAQILRAFDFSERTTMAERIIELENMLEDEKREHFRVVQRIVHEMGVTAKRALER